MSEQEDIILHDEDFSLSGSQDREIISETETLSVIPVKTYEEIDISSPVFTGFQVAGIVCFISLSIGLVLKYFKMA